ncbi:MAG: sulfate adenylyltransferase subunit 1 [Acidimicrobiales bacterium]
MPPHDAPASVSPPARSLLRVATAGSVDDGKSTLIGRLLYDTKTLMDDQLAAVERASLQRGDGYTNLALLTDGLRAEREQGITIDVAYRFFATPRRSFIVADTPGHAQYTRNMVTGASSADAAVVLVDARRGVLEQTRRHAYLSALLGVRTIVVAVNKMDLVGWDEHTFELIAKEVSEHVAAVAAVELRCVPISALHGDNVVERGDAAPWYDGPTLLELLESAEAAPPVEHGARLAVQWVVRPMSHEHHDYRGYAGQLAGGVLRRGEEVVVLPSGKRSRVAAIDVYEGELDAAAPGDAITLRLEDDLDVSRGDVIVAAEGPPPCVGDEIEADLCWMIDSPLTLGARCQLKAGASTVKAVVSELVHRLEVNTLTPYPNPERLELNDLGRVRLRVSAPLVADPYDRCRDTGRFIVIDEATNATAGAGLIRVVR